MIVIRYQVILALLLSIRYVDANHQSSNNKRHVFDYIVVGSGPTGSMVAMGLAEKGYETLLIDAGQDYLSANVTTPAFYTHAAEDPNMSWDFRVKHYAEETGVRQNVLYPRVAGLGGCTLHNAMIHILPNTADFQKMVEATGMDSWSEPNMRKYYEKITKTTVVDILSPMRAFTQLSSSLYVRPNSITKTERGSFPVMTSKWLNLSVVNIFNLLSRDQKLIDIVQNILKGAVVSNLLGFDINSYNIGGGIAVDYEKDFLIPINIDPARGGRRSGIAEQLHAAARVLPLTIWTNTLATKILMDRDNIAYGVKFLQGKYLYKAGKRINRQRGKPGRVYASREIIISAGTFNTPQLMMLSGIGDEKHLRKLGIKPRINNRFVGRNLHDRYEVSVNFKFDTPFTLLEDCTFIGDVTKDPCFKRFETSGTGPYSFNGVLTGSTIKSSPDVPVPDLFMLTVPINFWGYHTGMAQELVENKDIFTILILKAHTNNRAGYVRLNSKDPTDVPDINFKYFTQGADKDMPPIIKGIRDARGIMANFMSGHTEVIPGDHLQTDEELANHVIENAWGHHATGTMKMGHEHDRTAVVDGNFKVYGAKNLRVADMSIFGDIPGYFPVLYLYMVGAKAADAILADAL